LESTAEMQRDLPEVATWQAKIFGGIRKKLLTTILPSMFILYIKKKTAVISNIKILKCLIIFILKLF
jgi:hypothetical protein